MSVYKRGSKWCFDFWVGGKRYRGSIPEARVKAQADAPKMQSEIKCMKDGTVKRRQPLHCCVISSLILSCRGLGLTSELGEKMSTVPKA